MQMIDVSYLADVHEIQQTLLAYAVALDSRALEMLDRVFTPDARIDIPGVGVVDRAGYQAACRAGLGSLDATHHFTNAPLLSVDGDRAQARSYLVAQHISAAAEGGSWLMIGAWYNDELRRTAEGWRIVSRAGTPVWWSGNGALLGMATLPPAFERHSGHMRPDWWSA